MRRLRIQAAPAARVLAADPPWLFGDALPGAGRGASKHYPCMPIKDIMAFPLPPLDKDCILFMWRVAAMQQEALDVVKAWGFTLKSEIVWEKLTGGGVQGIAKEAFGMGHYVRMNHEVCLIAVRGKPVIRSHSERSMFMAPMGRHSAKPDEFYEKVEALCAGPYAELFARQHRPGWTCYGNELPEIGT